MTTNPLIGQRFNKACKIFTQEIYPLVRDQNLTKAEATVLLNKALFRHTRNSHFKVTESQVDRIYREEFPDMSWPSIMMTESIDNYISTTPVDNQFLDNLTSNIREASGYGGINETMVSVRLRLNGYMVQPDSGVINSVLQIPVAEVPEQPTTEHQHVIRQCDLDRAVAAISSTMAERISELNARIQSLENLATAPTTNVFPTATKVASEWQNREFNSVHGS